MFLKMYKMVLFSLLLFYAHMLPAQDSAFTNGIGMSFVLIKPGSMIVGRFQPVVTVNGFVNSGNLPRLPDSALERGEAMARHDAVPGFNLTIDHPYYIGKFEVTQEQWKKVMGANPSYFQGSHVKDNGDRHPVESVSWNDAQQFIKKLNLLEKGKAVYRLPSEFEWEYAARAGAQDDIPWKEIGGIAVIATNSTSTVGSKKPNAWGLYDMLGNVWEWVQDAYNEKIFADPVPPSTGKEHVLKGAPFYGDVKNATYMTHAGGPGSKYDVGFRVLMEVLTNNPPTPKIPAGFISIFDGRDLKGWHVSRSTHQGTTPDFHVEDGAIVGMESPYGQGGLLMTDKNYKSFELYLEAKIDSFANGGIFIRSNEGGAAYQVEMILPGNTGDLLGERISVSKSGKATDREKVWKANDWNAFRIRMVGDTPHITLWINDVKMWDVIQPRNDFIAGATEGMIALQCHWTALYSPAAGKGMPLSSWQPGAAHRYRNIAIKEIKNK
jgi:sulfatase modifying factor 1